MELVLRNLAETSQNTHLQNYQQALLYYSKNLEWPAPNTKSESHNPESQKAKP